MAKRDDDEIHAQMALLTDPNPSVRLAAALALQQIGGYLDKTLPVLVNDISAVAEDCLDDWQYALKFIGRPAIDALSRKVLDAELAIDFRVLGLRTVACEFYRDHAAASEQMQQLLSDEGELGAWAAVILALGDFPIHTHESYLNALRSDDPILVERAVYALHSFKNRPPDEVRRVKDAVLRCLIHPDDQVRGSCCMFVKFDLDEDDLRQLHLKDGDPINAVLAMLSKMETPPASTLNLIMLGLDSDDYDTRVTAAPIALVHLGAQSIEPVTELALDIHRSERARCAALGVLAQLKPLPTVTLQRLRSILDENGQLPIYAAVALTGQGIVDEKIIDRLVAGAQNEELDVKARLRRLPSEQTVPIVIAHLRRADDRKKQELAMLLGELGWNTPAAAEALVDEFANASDDTLRNRLANGLRYVEDLAVPPALNALSTYTRDEQFIWLMEGLEFVGRAAFKAIPRLLPLLQHQNPEVAFYTAKTISAIDPTQPGIVPLLLDALSDVRSRRRYEAMNRIQWLRQDAAAYVPGLIQLLDEEEFRERATQVLGEIGPAASAAIPRLVELMNESNYSSSPITSLAKLQNRETLPHLIAALDNERKLEQIIESLHWMKSIAEPMVAKLRTLLNGPYRLNVIKGLAELEEKASSAAPDLINLLDAEDLETRLAAINALGKLKSGGTRLVELAQDEDEKIRIAALTSLGGPKPIQAIPILMAAAESADLAIAGAAFQGLAGYGEDAPREFVPLLQRRFAEGDDIKWPILSALQQLGAAAEPFLPTLIPLLSKMQYHEPAFWTLDAIGPAAITALPELERLLKTRQYRLYARSSIWKIAPERARELQLIRSR